MLKYCLSCQSNKQPESALVMAVIMKLPTDNHHKFVNFVQSKFVLVPTLALQAAAACSRACT